MSHLRAYSPLALIVGLLAVSAAPTTAQAQQAYAYQNIFDDDTDLALTGMWAVDNTPANPSGAPASGGNSLNYNDGTDYDNGAANTGAARTPEINLTGVQEATMSFWCRYQTETTGTGYDQRWIRIYNATNNSQVYSQQLSQTAGAPLACPSMSTWHQHSYSAMPPAALGIPIIIEFFFDTVDNFGNAYPGWYIDDLIIIADDTAPPAVIGNLAAANPTETEVELTWTSPTDNDVSGQAASFDLRFATAPITQANFAQATEVTGEPAPGAPGTVHNVLVNGLNPGTTYYFAIVTFDYADNPSPISNVPSIDTLSPPPVGGGSATQAVVTEDKYANCGAGVAGSPLGLAVLAGLLTLAAAGRRFFGK